MTIQRDNAIYFKVDDIFVATDRKKASSVPGESKLYIIKVANDYIRMESTCRFVEDGIEKHTLFFSSKSVDSKRITDKMSQREVLSEVCIMRNAILNYYKTEPFNNDASKTSRPHFPSMDLINKDNQKLALLTSPAPDPAPASPASPMFRSRSIFSWFNFKGSNYDRFK